MQAFVDRKWKFGHSDEDIYNTIKNGVDSLGMPSFGTAYTEAEIRELTQYIAEGIKNVDKYNFETILTSDTFKTKDFSFHLDTVLTGHDSYWGMAFMPDGGLLATSKAGAIYMVGADGKLDSLLNVPSVLYKGQGGLLDITIHPNFSVNHWIYISYSGFKNEDGKTLSTTVVDRAVLDGNELTNLTRIFEALPYSTTRHHYGSRLEFDNEGLLYISVGDRGNHDENPQSLQSHCGKIHRINDDGSIPIDNPFVNLDSAVASIYSYGHRNPQGMALHPTTGEIWTHEHGPRGGDEINIIKPGLNYGWPVISYGLNYNGTILTSLLEKEGMEKPLLYWVPSIAPCGMTFVKSERYSGWENQLLVGSLRFKYLDLCMLDGDQVVSEERLMENIGRVRNVEISPDGFIYVSVERPGYIFKLVPIAKKSS
jgi:glucose/arabinose dehydrogenase